MDFIDDFDIEPPPAAQPRRDRNLSASRDPSEVPDTRQKQPVPTVTRPVKRQPRFLGDESDDEESRRTLDALFADLDDLPDDLSTAAPVTTNNNADPLGDVFNALPDLDDPLAPPGKKPRAPRPKLDEERLLAPNGFPRLRQEAKRFKFGPKGQETQDLKNLLSMYQLWAHQLFPATNFQDTVNRIENVCKKRQMTNALTNWRREAEGKAPLVNKDANNTDTGTHSPSQSIERSRSRSPTRTRDRNEHVLFSAPSRAPSIPPLSNRGEEDAGFNDADLDGMDFFAEAEALFAEMEEETTTSAKATIATTTLAATATREPLQPDANADPYGDEFELSQADLDAMMEMETQATSSKTAPDTSSKVDAFPEFDAEEEALLRQLEMEHALVQ